MADGSQLRHDGILDRKGGNVNTELALKLAEEAGITFVTEQGVASATPEWLVKFADLVEREYEQCHAKDLEQNFEFGIERGRELEREACVKFVDSWAEWTEELAKELKDWRGE